MPCECKPLAFVDDEWWAARDSNPRPPACKADGADSQPTKPKHVTAYAHGDYTTDYTTRTEIGAPDRLEALAEALRNLTADELLAIAEMLADSNR